MLHQAKCRPDVTDGGKIKKISFYDEKSPNDSGDTLFLSQHEKLHQMSEVIEGLRKNEKLKKTRVEENSKELKNETITNEQTQQPNFPYITKNHLPCGSDDHVVSIASLPGQHIQLTLHNFYVGENENQSHLKSGRRKSNEESSKDAKSFGNSVGTINYASGNFSAMLLTCRVVLYIEEIENVDMHGSKVGEEGEMHICVDDYGGRNNMVYTSSSSLVKLKIKNNNNSSDQNALMDENKKEKKAKKTGQNVIGVDEKLPFLIEYQG